MAELNDLEEGSILSVGSKEIEITGVVSREEWQAKVTPGLFKIYLLPTCQNVRELYRSSYVGQAKHCPRDAGFKRQF